MLNKSKIEDVSQKYNLYFRALSIEGKKRFINRTYKLSSEITIIGKDINVSDEMRIILYAYFVQMTFGFKQFTPGTYSVIHLYSREFQTNRSKNETEGKTFHDTTIALSWYHFSKSHLITDDGENLGYFHIGQALVQSLLNGKSSDDIFCSYFDLCAIQVFGELSEKRMHPFYLTHQNEVMNGDFQSIFPYLMELFFEKPVAMQNDLPNTYAHLCVLMNQDPLNTGNNFELNKEKYQNKKGINPLPTKILKNFSYYQNHWLVNIPLLNIIFLSVIFSYYVRPNILLTGEEIAVCYSVFSVVLFAALKKYVVERKLIKTQFWFALFTLTGLTPILMFFIFLIGSFTAINTEISSHEIIESYPIIKHTRRGGSYIDYHEVFFKNNFLDEFPNAREFYPKYNQYAPVAGAYASYEIGRCLFGFKVVKDKYLYKKQIEIIPSNLE